eukprot:jgi/Ulvmu1/9733/UM055_0073.1
MRAIRAVAFQPARAQHPRRCLHRRASPAKCNPDDPAKSGSAEINEDVLAKLRAFEEENKKLKEQLATTDSVTEKQDSKSKVRVDGSGMKRETLFGSSSSPGSWLSESDVDFFTGGGLTEQSSADRDAEESVVKRRLIIGSVLTVGTIALSLIPTEDLDGFANKPLYMYLVPLLRSIALLEDLAVEVEQGNMGSSAIVVDRILGKPNEARKNLYSAIESISPSQRQQAREAISNFVDYIQQIDYNKYYDTVGVKDGKLMAQYQDFSLKSIQSAIRTGNQILSMFPGDVVADARETLVPL